jgi:DNA mismatch repair protein MutS2
VVEDRDLIAMAPTAAAASSTIESVLVPDLLHPIPMVRVDREQIKQSMGFAFASGVSGGLFGDALDRAKVAPSIWEPELYVGDLFLEDFVVRCFRARIGGNEPLFSKSHLLRILASPPADPAIVVHRRAIVSELAESATLRSELEQLYLTLCRFRSSLEGATAGRKWDSSRRQLDILALARDVFDRMASGFASARSGLSRLHLFGERVRSGEPYRSLCHLLQYEDDLATVNLKVRVGSDGRVRDFEILSVQENDQNPFVASAGRRWLAKLELFFRGFRFSEGEVMARLIDAVVDGLADDLASFVQLLGDLEFYLGALGFRDHAHAAGLEVCLPDLVAADQPRTLLGLYNPLLVAHGVRAVPCDYQADRNDTTVLITGPNSGGKTRLLQSLGLTQVLAQAGVFVPARSGKLALSPGLVVSLIQETTADQAEGRLGMELIRIRKLFERLPPGAMVILDELCSGTNPSEGEEIFELVVRVLTRLRPQAFITTHFLTFAARLEREAKITDLRFLQVELDPSHKPTYQFVKGVAHTSLAQHAAARLGVTSDELLALVDRNLAKGNEGR